MGGGERYKGKEEPDSGMKAFTLLLKLWKYFPIFAHCAWPHWTRWQIVCSGGGWCRPGSCLPEMTEILNVAAVVGTCTHGRIFVFGGNINIHGLFSLKSPAQGLLCRALAIGQCVTETGDHVWWDAQRFLKVIALCPLFLLIEWARGMNSMLQG